MVWPKCHWGCGALRAKSPSFHTSRERLSIVTITSPGSSPPGCLSSNDTTTPAGIHVCWPGSRRVPSEGLAPCSQTKATPRASASPLMTSTIQRPCKRMSTLLCRSVLKLASLGADGRFIPVPLFKPISYMVKQKEDDDDLVSILWLTQIVYYHMPVSK